MRASQDSGPLLAALTELSGLAGTDDRAALTGLRERLAVQRLRVLVAGEAKRGKSTLVNAMLGRPVLPMGVTPLTALTTTVRYGTDEHAAAVFGDGHAERFPLSALDGLVTERGNPGNRRDLASVTVVADAPVLAHGVELADTPGTGSVYAHNTAQARAALEAMDAAVFVLTADPLVSASERDLIAQVAGLSVTMFVVLNKADYLDDDGLAEALGFTARVAGQAAGHPVRVYPLSARAALSGPGEPGFAAFMEDFTSYLDQGRVADLRLSVAAQAHRLAGSLADEVTLTRHAAQQRTGSAAGRVRAFAGRLAAVSARRQDAVDLAAAESARMLARLNAAAGQAAGDCAGTVGAQLEALLTGDLRAAAPAEIERAGRARLAELAAAAAETWRQQQAERLEQDLARLDGRLTQDLRGELAALRDAAAHLLGLALAVPGPGDRLEPDLRFFYLVAGQAGPTELLAGAVRTWLPGEAGRRRARAYLRREAASLVPQQIGRARADLQYRLAAATQQLTRAVASRYAQSTRRLEDALAAAAAARAVSTDELARLDAELADRERALGRVLTLLAKAGAAGPAPASAAAPAAPHGGATTAAHPALGR